MTNYFKVLGVSLTATTEEIHKSYFNKRKTFRQEHVGKNVLSDASMQECYNAVCVLQDDAKRKKHLEELKQIDSRQEEKQQETSPQTDNDYVEVVTRFFSSGRFREVAIWVGQHPLPSSVFAKVVELCIPAGSNAAAIVVLINDTLTKLASESKLSDGMWRNIAVTYGKMKDFYDSLGQKDVAATNYRKEITARQKISTKTDQELRLIADFYCHSNQYDEALAFLNQIVIKTSADNSLIVDIQNSQARVKLSPALTLVRSTFSSESCAAVRKIIDNESLNNDACRRIIAKEIYNSFIYYAQINRAHTEAIDFYERAITMLCSIASPNNEDLESLHLLYYRMLQEFCGKLNLFDNEQKDEAEQKDQWRRRIIVILQNNYIRNLVSERAIYGSSPDSDVSILSRIIDLLEHVVTKSDEDYRNIFAIYHKRMAIEILHGRNQCDTQEVLEIFNSIQNKNDADYRSLAEVRSLQAKMLSNDGRLQSKTKLELLDSALKSLNKINLKRSKDTHDITSLCQEIIQVFENIEELESEDYRIFAFANGAFSKATLNVTERCQLLTAAIKAINEIPTTDKTEEDRKFVQTYQTILDSLTKEQKEKAAITAVQVKTEAKQQERSQKEEAKAEGKLEAHAKSTGMRQRTAASFTFLSPLPIKTDAQHSAEHANITSAAMDTSSNDATSSIVINRLKKT